jgi:hypothetical protein
MHTPWQFAAGLLEVAVRWTRHLGEAEGAVIAVSAFLVVVAAYREVRAYRRNGAKGSSARSSGEWYPR